MIGYIYFTIFIIVFFTAIFTPFIIWFLDMLYTIYSYLFENSDFINFIKRKVERRRREQKAKETK